MIFKFLFKKEIREWQTRLDIANNRVRELSKLNDEATRLCSKLKLRLKRLEYLINDRLKNSEKLLIEKTDKGIDILTSLDFRRTEI